MKDLLFNWLNNRYLLLFIASQAFALSMSAAEHVGVGDDGLDIYVLALTQLRDPTTQATGMSVGMIMATMIGTMTSGKTTGKIFTTTTSILLKQTAKRPSKLLEWPKLPTQMKAE